MRRVLEAPAWTGRRRFSRLVDRVAIGIQFHDGPLPAAADLGVALQPHAAADFEDDAVELVAQEKVADVPLEERQAVRPGHEQVHVADRQIGPVADFARGQAQIAAAPRQQLHQRGHTVECAAVIPPHGPNAPRPDRQGVAFRPVRNVESSDGPRHLTPDQDVPASAGHASFEQWNVHEELVGHPSPEQFSRKALLFRGAGGYDNGQVRQSHGRAGESGGLRCGIHAGDPSLVRSVDHARSLPATLLFTYAIDQDISDGSCRVETSSVRKRQPIFCSVGSPAPAGSRSS